MDKVNVIKGIKLNEAFNRTIALTDDQIREKLLSMAKEEMWSNFPTGVSDEKLMDTSILRVNPCVLAPLRIVVAVGENFGIEVYDPELYISLDTMNDYFDLIRKMIDDANDATFGS